MREVILFLTAFTLGLTVYIIRVNWLRWRSGTDPLGWACATIGIGIALRLALSLDFYWDFENDSVDFHEGIYILAVTLMIVGYIEIVRMRIKERRK
jgi:hypothetical protein